VIILGINRGKANEVFCVRYVCCAYCVNKILTQKNQQETQEAIKGDHIDQNRWC
jgi:hypothetical protein